MEAIRNNFVFSEEKFQVSPRVTFAGLELTATSTGTVEVLPDRKRIETLLNLSPPTNRKELQSVVGLMSTFQKWIPGLSLKDKPIRQLMKKTSHFRWTQEQQDCFEEINKIMGEKIQLNPFNKDLENYIYIYNNRAFVCIHPNVRIR